jgi:hypothetical protein
VFTRPASSPSHTHIPNLTHFRNSKSTRAAGKGSSRHTLSKHSHSPSSSHLNLHGRHSDKLVAVEIQSLQELPTHRTLETDHFYILDTHTRSRQSQSRACFLILSTETHFALTPLHSSSTSLPALREPLEHRTFQFKRLRNQKHTHNGESTVRS